MEVDEMELRSISSTTAVGNIIGFDNTWRCIYSFVLLMMGEGTAWNM